MDKNLDTKNLIKKLCLKLAEILIDEQEDYSSNAKLMDDFWCKLYEFGEIEKAISKDGKFHSNILSETSFPLTRLRRQLTSLVMSNRKKRQLGLIKY